MHFPVFYTVTFNDEQLEKQHLTMTWRQTAGTCSYDYAVLQQNGDRLDPIRDDPIFELTRGYSCRNGKYIPRDPRLFQDKIQNFVIIYLHNLRT